MEKRRIRIDGSQKTFLTKTITTAGRTVELFSRDGKRWDSNPKYALLFTEREEKILSEGTAHNPWGNLSKREKDKNRFLKYPFKGPRRGKNKTYRTERGKKLVQGKI